MRFAYAVPSWVLTALVLAALALSMAAYWRARATLGPARYGTLAALRAAAFLLLIAFLLRPVVPAESDDRQAVVAVVIDSSRSMELRDRGANQARIARAAALVRDRLVPALSPHFTVALFADTQRIDAADLDGLTTGGVHTDLQQTLRLVEDRFAAGNLAGIVLISDGAETITRSAPDAGLGGAPVVTIGIGDEDVFDREIRSVTVGPSVLDGSLVDLTVSAVASGDRAGAMRLRLVQHGRVVELADLTGVVDGSPVQHVFTVAPAREAPSLFRVEVDGDPGELTLENNRVDVVVAPPGRRRRILMIEGAPGHEHTFIKRAWQQDASLDVDAVIRKGRNERGEDTYYVQAAGDRSSALAEGFPDRREALLHYDAVVLASLDPQRLSHEQLDWLADFVGERGGGLLVLGSRSLMGTGLDGSALARVMPLGTGDARGDVALAAAVTDVDRLKVGLTAEGGRHPLMRLGQTDEETRARWAALPPLASVETLGAPRPGAAVLAVTTSGAGTAAPLVAVQRFGRGRAMVFAGEASWRWKMLLPSTDRTFDTFWRQAIRWLSVESPDPVTVSAPAGVPLGAVTAVEATVRDAAFRAVRDAAVEMTVVGPDGASMALGVSAADGEDGRYIAALAALQRGIYRLSVTARQGRSVLGSAEHLVLSGGIDPELIDPRLNPDVLKRLAAASGGRYVQAADAGAAAAWLRDAASQRREELRDLWHGPWAFLLVVGLLSVEWTLRRRWGLR